MSVSPKKMCLLALSILSFAALSSACEIGAGDVDVVRSERISGSLATAEIEARQMLACPSIDPGNRLSLQIELARILDRVGLHTNTRPVEEALEILRSAEGDLAADDVAGRAAIVLALAEYFYRAEMADREFTIATTYALEAERLFHRLADPVGETDAVHRLGLIEFQKRNLEAARVYFDRSLEISRAGPDRLIFLSDYHRHIGFVDLLSGDQQAAIAHFEKSLAYRNEAGSKDYGLFARTMLATTLIDAGRPQEAKPYLDEALISAPQIPSPVGEMRSMFALARMYEELGKDSRALTWYAEAQDLAAELGVESIQKNALEARKRIEGSQPLPR